MMLLKHGHCLLFFWVLLAIPVFASAEKDVTRLMLEANAAYGRGDYDRAILTFQRITEENGYSASVLYNLANSYAQKGRIGLAIVNYERARRLAPANADIRGNLAKLREEAGLFAPDQGLVERFFSFFSGNGWAIIGSGCIGAAVLLLLWQFWGQISPIPFGGFALGITFCLVLASVGVVRSYRDDPWIVVDEDVQLLVSPFEGAGSLGALAEGKKLYSLGKRHGHFFFVRDASGRRGWLSAQAVLPIHD
ncbi:MAG: hypothetical protein CSB23_04470 [Deltaproteobacteria bacterium]|nr:MAG: hypothetical protein CSB23_04470 [Deltaproteobacteria bacterium]